MPSLEACERLQGFPPGWTIAAADNGEKNARWRLVGNAVSVPVLKWVGERIKSPRAVADFELIDSDKWQRWPEAAWNIENDRVGVVASDKPIAVELPSISEFRNHNWTRLSDRALNGFIGARMEGACGCPKDFWRHSAKLLARLLA